MPVVIRPHDKRQQDQYRKLAMIGAARLVWSRGIARIVALPPSTRSFVRRAAHE